MSPSGGTSKAICQRATGIYLASMFQEFNGELMNGDRKREDTLGCSNRP
jgi:hypothetical protein